MFDFIIYYNTIDIFANKVKGGIVVCWDSRGPSITCGFYLDTIGM